MRFLTLLLLLSVPAFARAPNTVPNPRFQGTWIVDEGDVLTSAEKRQLDTELDNLQRDTGAEFAVVVLRTIGDSVPKQFATALFQTWGIGKQGSDNGLLLLLVLDQRRAEFETGYGLEGILTDVKLAHILREKMTPKFRAKDMGGGVRAGASAVIEELRANAEEVRGRGHSRRTFLPIERYLLASGLACAFLLFAWIAVSWLRRKDPYLLSEDFGAGTVLLWYAGMLTLAFEAALHELRFQQEWISLAPGGAVFLAFIFSRVSFERWRGKLRFAPRICTCGNTMQRVTLPTDRKRCLSHNQQVEQDIQSVDYEAWRCSCGKTRADSYSGLRASMFERCQGCQSLADERTEIETVKTASFFSSGLLHYHYCCRACGKTRIKEVRPQQQSSDSSSSYGGSSGSSSSSSSDFGGGSSGGGGAGDSW